MDEHAEQLAGVTEGQILAGKYRVESVLGVGGMGVVVAARHVVLGSRVALKFLLPGMLSNQEAVDRFAREARNAVRIQNEHVARVSDVGTLDNGAPYMVMEFLEGGDLASWLRERGPLPVEQAVDFVLQACVAVADAHGLGIIHRDLKPANLFCIRRSDGQFVIKVLDFGISKLTDAARASEPPGISATRTTAVMGSPFYMSPEQVQSAKDVDTRTDLWALGVILFELLTGTVPFPGEAFGEIAVKIAMQETPPLRSYRPDAPPGLEAVIRTSLEKDRKRRFPNVAELAVALAPFAPPRAGATVERIRGIIEAAGLSVSPSAPPSAAQVRQKTLLAQESVAPWSDTLGPVRSRRAVVWSVGIVGIVVAGAIAARSISQPPVIHSASALASVQPPPVAVTIDAALPSPTENRTPEHLAPLPTTTATLSAPPPAREETPPPRVPAAATLRSAPTAHVTSPLSAPTVTVLAPPTAPRPPPTAPPSARPNCDPPFTLDEQGQRHYKPECYLGK